MRLGAAFFLVLIAVVFGIGLQPTGLVEWIWSEPPTLISRADALCSNLWVNGARNDPALDCYLQKDVARFCDVKERKHLANTFTLYMSERTAFYDKIKDYQSGMSLGMAQAAAAHPEEDTMHMVARVGRENAERIVDEDFRKAWKLHTILDQDLAKSVSMLVTAGYISRSDFGWYPGPIVEMAFEDVKTPERSPCWKP